MTMAALRMVWFSLLFISTVKGQATSAASAYGTYFRMVFIDNFVDYPLKRPVDLYVCNKGTYNNEVNVTIPYYNRGDCPKSVVDLVAPRDCHRFKLCDKIRHTYADGSLSRKVVEIFAQSPISVQGFNVEKFSADAYHIIPWELNNHVHYVMSYTLQSIQTQFAIVAKETTSIRITIPQRRGETITVDYNGLRYSNGESFTFELKPENSYLAQSAGDLTGVMIQSSRRVAVFTGNVRTFNDYNETSRDHLVEQVPGTHRWGKDFIYVPTPRAVKGDVLKMIALSEGTRIEFISETRTRQIIIGKSPLTLELSELTHIRAQKAILVAVFVRSQDGRESGIYDPADPSMYILPSVEQFAGEFLMPRFRDAEEHDYQKVWALVAVPDDQVLNLMVDGVRADLTSLSSVSKSRALPFIAGAVAVNPSRMHRFVMNGAKFMAIGYGAKDRESFASTLGYRFNLFGCEETDMLKVGDGIDNDCDNVVDEEICGNQKDDDKDGLVDEDCKSDFIPPTYKDASGTHFVVGFMSNVVRDMSTASFADQVELYIASMEDGTVLTVTSPMYDGPGAPMFKDVAASKGSVIQLPISSNMKQTSADSTLIGRSTISNKGINIVSNRPVAVYGISKNKYSTDSFFALPVDVLGSEYYAFCNSPIVLAEDRCQLAVVAVQNNTRINIDVRSGITMHGIETVPEIVGPTTVTVMLQSFQVLEVQSVDDITGTRVYTADGTPFSFFSGNVRARVPAQEISASHLVEQLLPTNSWGKAFATMATTGQSNDGDLFKIIAKEDNSQLTFFYYDDSQIPREISFTLQRGDHREIFMNNSFPIHIEADKPVLVMQITKSAPLNNMINSPSVIMVVPEDMWTRDYRFVTPLSSQKSHGFQLSFNNYIILTVRRRFKNGLYLLDTEGRQINMGTQTGWRSMSGNLDIEGLVFRLPRGQGQMFIGNRNPDATWMALLYGKANMETYGSAIGMRFTSQYSGCVNGVMKPGDKIDNDCDGNVDEEMSNGVDDDGDGKVDEDLGLQPTGYKYIFAFQENLVEYPRHYALEMYVGPMREVTSTCRMQTPERYADPTYDITTVIHDPARKSDKIQFAVASSLRTRGTNLRHSAIVMTCDQPVTVMGINKETYSTDAFTVLEESLLGKEYYSVSFSPASLRTQFAVIAVENGTTIVEVALKTPIIWNRSERSHVNVHLAQYQVFQAQSGDDLTGSHIIANKPVAVFSGNIRTKVDLSESRDHLASQIPPVTSWGMRFNIVPTWFRSVGDIFRVVAEEDNTVISWNMETTRIARAGGYVDLNLGTMLAFLLTSTRPVLVMQIVKSQASAYNREPADPCWHVVLPEELYTNKTTVVTPLYSRGSYKDGEHFKNYLTIITPQQTENGIRVNGMSVGSNPDIIDASTVAKLRTYRRRTILGSNYVAIDLIIQKPGLGTYEIININPSVKFSGYLVGVADRESYCVPLGNQ